MLTFGKIYINIKIHELKSVPSQILRTFHDFITVSKSDVLHFIIFNAYPVSPILFTMCWRIFCNNRYFPDFQEISVTDFIVSSDVKSFYHFNKLHNICRIEEMHTGYSSGIIFTNADIAVTDNDEVFVATDGI